MKQYISYFVLLLTIVFVSGCTAQKTQMAKQTSSTPLKRDFFTTGRELSKGSVDLYQPGTDFLPTAQFPNNGRGSVSPVPGNANIVVNDPNVTIYSLDTMEVREPQPAPLPPLQPPSKMSDDYPSPFDQDRNFSK